MAAIRWYIPIPILNGSFGRVREVKKPLRRSPFSAHSLALMMSSDPSGSLNAPKSNILEGRFSALAPIAASSPLGWWAALRRKMSGRSNNRE
jgi:hypothetical protein